MEANRSRMFQLSNLRLKDLDPKMVSSLHKIGGQIVEKPDIDRGCTHLIVGYISKTEKILLALAKGIWILKEDFLRDSVEHGDWQQEEPYDWGEGKVKPGFGISIPSFQFRKQLAQRGCFFSKKRVILILDEPFLSVYKRLFE